MTYLDHLDRVNKSLKFIRIIFQKYEANKDIII